MRENWKRLKVNFFFLVNIMPAMRAPESPEKCWIPIQTKIFRWISGKISKMLDMESAQVWKRIDKADTMPDIYGRFPESL